MSRNQSKSVKKEDKRKSNNRKCSTGAKKESKGKKFMNMLRPTKSNINQAPHAPSPQGRPNSPRSASSPQQRTDDTSQIMSVSLGPLMSPLSLNASEYFSPSKKKKPKNNNNTEQTEKTNECEAPTSKENIIGDFFSAPFRRKKTTPVPAVKPATKTPHKPNTKSIITSPYIGDEVEMPKCSAENAATKTECLSRERIEPTCETTVALSRERIDPPNCSRETTSKEKTTGKNRPRVSHRIRDPPSHLVPTVFETVNVPLRPLTENPKFIVKQAQARRRKIQSDIVAARHEKHHLAASMPDNTMPSSANDPSQIQSAPEMSNRGGSEKEKQTEKELPKSSHAIANKKSDTPSDTHTKTQDSKTEKTERAQKSAASPRKKKKKKPVEMPQAPPPLPPPVVNLSAENLSINVTMENALPQEGQEPVDAGCATAYAPVNAAAAPGGVDDENCQTAMKPISQDTCQTAIKPVTMDDNCQTAMKPTIISNEEHCQTALKPVTMEPLDAGTATAYQPVSTTEERNCQTAMKPLSMTGGLIPVNFDNPNDPGKSLITAQSGHFGDSTPTAMLPASKMGGSSTMTAVNDPGKSLLTAQSGQFGDTTPTAMLPASKMGGTSLMTATAVQIVNEAAGASTMTAVGGKRRGEDGGSVMTGLGNPPPTASAITAVAGAPAPVDAAYFGMK